MLTKLTLTIERSIIARAKEYARDKNRSVSKMVEEYLRNVSGDENSRKLNAKLESPITDSIIGMFSDSGKDYKSMLEDALAEKYL